MDEELDYISSSPLMGSTPPIVKPEDEAKEPTLKRVSRLLEETIAAYGTVDRLVVDEGTLTVKEQLAVNKAVIYELSQVKATVDTVINDIREKYSDE